MGSPKTHRNSLGVKKTRLGYMGKSEGFLQLRFDFMDALAYRSLSPLAQSVLIRMLRRYQQESGFDSRDIKAEGFTFPWSACKTPISERAFSKVMREIEAHGFFQHAYWLTNMPGQPKRYIPSHDWETFKMPDADAAAWAERKAGKKQRVKRNRSKLSFTPDA